MNKSLYLGPERSLFSLCRGPFQPGSFVTVGFMSISRKMSYCCENILIVVIIIVIFTVIKHHRHRGHHRQNIPANSRRHRHRQLSEKGVQGMSCGIINKCYLGKEAARCYPLVVAEVRAFVGKRIIERGTLLDMYVEYFL